MVTAVNKTYNSTEILFILYWGLGVFFPIPAKSTGEQQPNCILSHSTEGSNSIEESSIW